MSRYFTEQEYMLLKQALKRERDFCKKYGDDEFFKEKLDSIESKIERLQGERNDDN